MPTNPHPLKEELLPTLREQIAMDQARYSGFSEQEKRLLQAELRSIHVNPGVEFPRPSSRRIRA